MEDLPANQPNEQGGEHWLPRLGPRVLGKRGPLSPALLGAMEDLPDTRRDAPGSKHLLPDLSPSFPGHGNISSTTGPGLLPCLLQAAVMKDLASVCLGFGARSSGPPSTRPGGDWRHVREDWCHA